MTDFLVFYLIKKTIVWERILLLFSINFLFYEKLKLY